MIRAFMLVILSSQLSAAQPYSRRIWRVEDGLPQNRIQALAQTPDGYLWIGTSEGLARFDGVRFTVFGRSSVPAFHDDSILSLKTSRDGSLWIGTEGGGLVHYQGGAFRAFADHEGITNGFIRAIFEDPDGTLWVGADRGFFRRWGTGFERMDGTADIPLASVSSILRDPVSHQLLITSSAGLLTVEGGKLKRLLCPAGAQGPRSALHASGDGTVRVVTASGASIVRNGCSTPDPAIPHASLTLLYEDRASNLWIGTFGEGLFRLRSGVLTRFEAPATLPDNHVTALLEDLQENIWVGGSDGLLRLSRTAVTTIGVNEGLDDHNISSVYEDRHQVVWLATLTGQLYRLNNGKPVRVHLPPPVDTIPIRSIYEDSHGVYWYGTSGRGVIRSERGRAVLLTTKEGLRTNNVRQILEDSAGRIWIATGSGLSLWEGTRFRNYYLEDGLTYPSLRCLALDRNGDLLIGSDGGLDVMRNLKIVRDPVYSQLSKEKVWAIHLDPEGTLWLGTRGSGLIRIKAGKIAHITTREGLPGNTIYQILEDAQNKFWLSGPLGIFSIHRRELDRAADGGHGPMPFVSYGSADGMETSQMAGGLHSPGVRTAAGEIWFASIKGAVRINPQQLPVMRSMPVFIERIVADGHAQPAINGEIEIPPGLGRLAIDFTTCNLASPQRESYRYRLENFEDAWTQATRVRTATYTNVPPGRYRFRVMANDVGLPGRVSEASLALAFQPAWHQTSWFYTLCFLVAAGLVWGAFRLYTKQTSARYDLLLAERTRLAREMHDTVIQGCVGVSTLLAASSKFQATNLEESNKLLSQAQVEVKATIDEARQAVWNLRHLSGDQSSIPVLFNLARKLARENAIETDTETVGNQVPLDENTDRILLLVGREALRNAVSHGHPSRVTVRLIFQSSEVRLEVRDDGAGFDPAQSIQENGHYGIIGMRERVEQAGGRFAIESERGRGTLVAAGMPLTARRFRD